MWEIVSKHEDRFAAQDKAAGLHDLEHTGGHSRLAERAHCFTPAVQQCGPAPGLPVQRDVHKSR